MTVLIITGARGFLGRELCRRAADQGYQVLGLVPNPKAHPDDDSRIVYLSPDHLPYDEFLKALNTCEVLIHAGGPYCLDLEISNGEPNLLKPEIGTVPVLYDHYVTSTTEIISWAMQMPNLKYFINLSSTAIASGAETIAEAPYPLHNPAPKNPLGAAALACERMVASSDGWTSPHVGRTTLRLGTLIGDSKTGYFPKISGIYTMIPFIFQLYRRFDLVKHLPLIPMPFEEHAKLSLIPVDVAAIGILGLCSHRLKVQNSSAATCSLDPVDYRHLMHPGREVSMRRAFAACMRDAGIEVPPLAFGHSVYLEKFYHRFGLDTWSLSHLPTFAHWSHTLTKAEIPDFEIKPMIHYLPTMLDYAKKHLVHQGADRGQQTSTTPT